MKLLIESIVSSCVHLWPKFGHKWTFSEPLVNVHLWPNFGHKWTILHLLISQIFPRFYPANEFKIISWGWIILSPLWFSLILWRSQLFFGFETFDRFEKKSKEQLNLMTTFQITFFYLPFWLAKNWSLLEISNKDLFYWELI